MEKLWGYKRVFEHFDTDGDGKISPTELREGIALVSGEDELSIAEAEEVVAAFDSNGDGQLEEDEFLRFLDGGGDKEKEIKEAFKMYEMEGSGLITAASLRKMMKKLGMSVSLEDCKTMIARFDLDRDGVLSFEEFNVMMS